MLSLSSLCFSIEDEVHFSINCRTYNETTNISLDSALKLNPHFSSNTAQEKFAFLLSCENLSVEVANFGWHAMELRKPLTKLHNLEYMLNNSGRRNLLFNIFIFLVLCLSYFVFIIILTVVNIMAIPKIGRCYCGDPSLEK